MCDFKKELLLTPSPQTGCPKFVNGTLVGTFTGAIKALEALHNKLTSIGKQAEDKTFGVRIAKCSAITLCYRLAFCLGLPPFRPFSRLERLYLTLHACVKINIS